jgi:polyisoprenoid-binding protein YceI
MTTDTATKTTWSIDNAHSEISFKVKHLMISNVKGTFGNFEGKVEATDHTFEDAAIQFSIHTDSIKTGDEKRDGHLTSPDFFDTANFKTISFQSTAFKKKTADAFELHGNLTMKGITLPVKLAVEFGGLMKDPWGNEKAGFTLEGKINRKDWGLNWNAALEAGGVMVSEEVSISADVQLLKKP